MAPNVEQQTYDIICCLFNERGFIETDGVDDGDEFDPVKIAEKLRHLGDDYDKKVIQPLIQNIQQAAKDQVASAFSDSVDGLCKAWVGERAEVATEKQLLKASITLGLYVLKNCPDMNRVVQDAMATFLNTRLASWISRQGGWEQVSSS